MGKNVTQISGRPPVPEGSVSIKGEYERLTRFQPTELRFDRKTLRKFLREVGVVLTAEQSEETEPDSD